MISVGNIFWERYWTLVITRYNKTIGKYRSLICGEGTRFIAVIKITLISHLGFGFVNTGEKDHYGGIKEGGTEMFRKGISLV